MMIVRMFGGLGNQLFQYATARSVALRSKTKLHIDDSALRRDPLRTFELSAFEIPIQKASLTSYLRMGTHPIYARFIRKFPLLPRLQFLHEENMSYEPRLLTPLRGAILDGYWQDASYFEDSRSTLLQEIQLKSKPDISRTLFRILTGPTSVGVHIRRGDYVSNAQAKETHGTLELSYYTRAMNVVRSQFGPVHFVVFSDDIPWAKSNLSPIETCEITFVEPHFNLSSAQELILMSRCKHQIIANSSFSWWAAWLNTNESKKVIGPMAWYQKESFRSKNPMPALWERI